MNFDINAIAADMLAAMKAVLPKNRPEIEAYMKQFAQKRKETLELLAEQLRKGEITLPKLESRLEDEKIILEAELLAIKVMTKALAQNAANVAIDTLTKAVKSAIKIVI